MGSGATKELERQTGEVHREESRAVVRWVERMNQFTESFVPAQCRDNAELTRRARLIIKFSRG